MADGNVAFAGDQVQVKFTNGIFGGVIKQVGGRKDGAVMVLFRGKDKARSIAPRMILKKA